jgi:hypothetical protein
LLKSAIQPINDKLDEHSAKLNELQTGQNKHSIILEELKNNMNTVIEGQQVHTEQIDRQFTSLNKDIKEDSTLIKSALKSVSSDVKNIKQKLIH